MEATSRTKNSCGVLLARHQYSAFLSALETHLVHLNSKKTRNKPLQRLNPRRPSFVHDAEVVCLGGFVNKPRRLLLHCKD